ncbi:hypothetical protein PC9H_005894 [Pleurotus ostreatus]|uniref:Uncharacterized protein n=1 Tax=Pleurotus ostreatus TaxID=5322 RepID=A0A8H6ZSU5_PLEOS|nr:uncharacterized protein PC9H_005894 [Pleurotus ostreatus]KAF7430194.1 hypothetical protein PC9H_005894 [Pleurotus ostreatus]
MKFARLLRVDHKLTSRLVHGPADFGLRVAHSACHEVGTSTEHGEYISTLKQDIHAHRLYFRSQVEAMDNLSLSTRTRAPTDINDIDLARPVAALAETISKAMSGLYALHVAIGRSGGEASSALVEFVECKQLIRNHWAALESFLQHSLGYARDYLGLCQSLQHENQAQYMVLASAILAHAQQIRGEIFRFQPAYTQMVKEFNAKEPAVKSRGSDKPVNGSSFDASISSFVVASHAALYPEIGKSFKAASAALCGSLVPIADISAFWDQHTYNLIALSRSEEELKRLTQNRSYFDMEITRWKAYRTALHDGVYSITSSSDAMMVTPMIQESNWRRRLGRFFPKRRTTNPVTGRSEIPAVEIGGPNAEYDSLKNPFNVLILSRTTYTINACLESFSQRFGQNSLMHRLGIYDRLYRLAQQYMATLSDMEALSNAAIEFCTAVQASMQSRGRAETSVYMRNSAQMCSSKISEILPVYQDLSCQLQQELSRTLSRQHADTPSPNSDDWNPDLLIRSIRALKDRELLACIHSTLERLIHLLTKFRTFWFNMAADVDQFRSYGRVGSSMSQQITPVWQRVEVLLHEYKSELGRAKTLAFACTPSNEKGRESAPTFFKRRRNTVGSSDISTLS